MHMVTQNLQVKLSFDSGLQNIWNYLNQEYEGLDKAGIIRLALNNLMKTTRQQNAMIPQFNMKAFFRELEQNKEGPTEKEFTQWWNENK